MRQEPDGQPRPFAVGVLALRPTPRGLDRTAARLDLALDTYRLGYFLIDTVEIDNHGTGYLTAELLLSHATPDALVTAGPVDTHWLTTIADRHPVAIHACGQHPRPSRTAMREALRWWRRN